MHIIIKNKYLKKIKNFLIYINNYSKNNFVLLNVFENQINLSLYTNDSFIKLNLQSDSENLKIKKTGIATLEIKTFTNLIESLEKTNDLEIYKAEKNYLQFFSGKFNCNLVLLDSKIEKEPEITVDESQKISIPYALLKNSYQKLKDFCKNPDSAIISNSILTNMNFDKEKDNDYLRVWASDSYRAIFGEFRLNDLDNKNNLFNINLSPLIIHLILGLFSEFSSENLNLYIEGKDKDYLICKNNEYLIKTKINTSKYPEFIHWFNMDKKISFIVKKTDLIEAIERNLLLADKNIKTTLYRTDDNKLFIEYKDGEKGSCIENIDIKVEKKGKIEFSLNNLLLKPLIKFIDSNFIVFNIYDSLKPIVLESWHENPELEKKEIFKQFIIPAKYA